MENNVIHQICNFYDHGKWNGGFSGYVSCVSRYKFRINIENEKLKVHSGRGYHIPIYTDLWWLNPLSLSCTEHKKILFRPREEVCGDERHIRASAQNSVFFYVGAGSQILR